MVDAISIRNLTKSYGDFVAVKNLNLKIKKGEFFGFLGPNGAGKTTTINTITGLSTIQKGNVKVFGHDVVKDYIEARKLIGLSPQETDFDPFFPIRDLLRFHAGYHGIPKYEALKRIDKLFEEFGLTSKAKLNYRKLSGGMKRRVALALALVHNPEILILDEPTAGLDVELRRDIWKFMKKYNEEGKTILLTTHYIEEAQKLCNRIGIINNGQLIALDDKTNLMEDLSKQHMKVKAIKKLNSVPTAIKKISEKSEIMDGQLLIHLNKSSKIDNILKTVQDNIRIKNLKIEGESLEEIFVRLIKND